MMKKLAALVVASAFVFAAGPIYACGGGDMKKTASSKKKSKTETAKKNAKKDAGVKKT